MTDYIERNYNILKQKMIEQMQQSLKFGRDLVESELDANIFNALVKPIVRSFYNYWSDKDAKIGTMEQIRITLDTARELIKNGEITKEKFEQVVNRNFPIYLMNDQTDRQCKKTHKNYEKLKEITKKCFITQVEESILFLSVKDDVKDYNELSRAAYKTKENAIEYGVIKERTFLGFRINIGTLIGLLIELLILGLISKSILPVDFIQTFFLNGVPSG